MFVKEDFGLEHCLIKDFVKALPYVKIKEDKYVRISPVKEFKLPNFNVLEELYENGNKSEMEEGMK